MKNHKNLSYVLITPARNEDAFIEKTIQSVVSQTVLPKKWIIVSDGSTDRTDEIVKKYAARNNWIELLRMPEHKERHFAAKAVCFNAGCQKVKGIKHDIIGNLDADLSFEKDYFEFLLGKFAENAALGVAGTPFIENSSHYDYNFTNIEHVSGACQLFRRKCFEEIGGYMLIKGGGIDFVAVTTARMKGWKTRTFPEKIIFHHRKIGTGNNSYMMSWLKQGIKDYSLGNHLLWEIFRACYQMTKKPYLAGGLFLFFGYVKSFLSRMEMPVSQKLVKFIRNEQMQRLKNIFHRRLKIP
jgi:glycosyltransferase involved in cell wall biosynthesis